MYKRLIAALLCICLMAPAGPVWAVQPDDVQAASSEEELRQAVLGDPQWTERYPMGLFNFIGGDFSVREDQEFYEFAVARQGGTEGQASIDLKLIDVSAKYGDDYIIRIYDDKSRTTFTEISSDGEVFPLMDMLPGDVEIDLSQPEESDEETAPGLSEKLSDGIDPGQQASSGGIDPGQPVDNGDEPGSETDGKNFNAGDGTDAGDAGDDTLTEGAVEGGGESYAKDTADESAAKEAADESAASSAIGNTGTAEKSGGYSLREAYETYTGVESDRQTWRQADAQSAEALEAAYDEVYDAIPGAAGRITFSDGEYIKYLRIIPVNHEAPSGDRQSMMVLTNPSVGAFRGEAYTAAMQILDDQERAPGRLSLQQSDVTAEDGRARVTVMRSGNTVDTESILVGTREDSAISGADYSAGLKELTFLPGVTTQTVTVEILPNQYRNTPRVFYIVLDGENVRADKDRRICAVTIPADPNAAGADDINAKLQNEVLEPDDKYSFDFTGIGAERISEYGASGQKGVWSMNARDFSGWMQNAKITGLPLSVSTLKIQHNGGEGYAFNYNTRLYGVDHIESYFSNYGYGKDYWSWFRWHHEYRYRAGMKVNGDVIMARDGKHGFENHVSSRLTESQWNNREMCFWTWAYDGNSVDMTAYTAQLHLKEYTVKTAAAEQLPKIDYTLTDKGTLKQTSQSYYNPGTLQIERVNSKVGNEKSVKGTSTTAYRSDLLKFTFQYSGDNRGGKFAVYDGFRIKNGNGWIEYRGSGTSELCLDVEFFQKPGMLDAIRSGTIEIQPIFKSRAATAVLNCIQTTGYFANLGSGVRNKTITDINVGDTIGNILGRTNGVSLTPKLSAETSSLLSGAFGCNNPDVIEITDTATGNAAKLKIEDVYTRLDLSVVNPTLKVQADPGVYSVHPGEVKYTVDGASFASHEAFAVRMKQALDSGQNPEITMAFTCESNAAATSQQLEYLKTPVEAVLTVYRTEGDTIRMKSNTTIPYHDGFSLTGRLKTLGWEEGDFAAVVIYGTSNLGRSVSTRETVIDFMLNTRDGITVTGPNKTPIGGDIRKPTVISNASPASEYEMNAFGSPGFIARWADYSSDFNGDGIETPEEKAKALSLLQKLGFQGKDLSSALDTTLYYGNTFFLKPSFFPETKVYYDFAKKQTGGTEDIPVYVQLTQKSGTVLDPDITGKARPLQNAAVIVGSTQLENVKDNIYSASAQEFQKGQFYLGKVLLNPYIYYFRAQPGRTSNVELNTSDVMRPINFKTTVAGKAVNFSNLVNGAKVRTVDIVSGNTEFSYQFQNINTGITPNNSVIRIYDENDQLKFTFKTGTPASDGRFTYTLDTLAQGIKPGYTMSIAGALDSQGDDGIQTVEYPEVFVGFTFSQKLTALNVAASFDTPVSPALKLFGEISAEYDLGADVDLGGQFDLSGFTDGAGRERVLKTVTFGFNKKNVQSLIAKIQKTGEGAKKESAANPKPTGKTDIQEKVDEKGGTKESVKQVANDGQVVDKETQKSRGSGKGAVAFDFNVALIVVLEEGQREMNDDSGRYIPDGYNYFSAFNMVATATASADYTYTYVTPIGIPVMASLKASGSAVFTYGIEADAENPYSTVYRFDGNGNVSLNPANYLTYIKFYVDPQITVGAGVGFSLLNVMLYGKAAFDLEFYQAVTGSDKSTGTGGVTFSADVAVKVLFISKQWQLYKSDRIEMFSYSNDLFNYAGFDQSYRRLGTTDGGDMLSRDYLMNKSDWLAGLEKGVTDGGEQILIDSAYPYPQTKLLQLDGEKRLMLFIDDDPDRDERNRAVLKYTVYDGSEWRRPEVLEDDGTWDESPDAFVVGDQVLIVWSDAARIYGEHDGEISALTQVDLTGCWFDANTLSAGEAFKLTQSNTGDLTADMKPQISASEDLSQLMIYYTKIDYTGSRTAPDADLSATEALPPEDEALYGDVVNGYNTICFRRALRQTDGSYHWETEYDDDENFPPGFQNQYYGQRFLKLTVPADIIEEVTKETVTVKLESGETAEIETGTRIDQRAVFNGDNPQDLRAIDCASALCGGKAVLAYTVDVDSDLKTQSDQRLYLMLYTFDTGGFSTPVLLSGTEGCNQSPQFIEHDGATWLYWLKDGNIVCMNISGLLDSGNNAGNSLIELNVEGAPAEGGVERILVVSKENGQDGIEPVVSHGEDRAITDFSITNGGNETYLVWVDDCVSYLDEAAGNGDPANIVKERQLFAACLGGAAEAGGQERGLSAQAGNLAGTGDGANKPGGAASEIDEPAGAVFGSWSEPVQITFDQGANFSDLSLLAADGALEVSYIRYEQELNDEGVYVPRETGRQLAVRRITIESTLELGELVLDKEQLVLPGSTVPASVSIKNTGVKPLNNVEFRGFAVRNGQEVWTGGWKPLAESFSEGTLEGGHTGTAMENFVIENPDGTEIGFVVRAAGGGTGGGAAGGDTAGDGNETASETFVFKAAPNVEICVNSAEMTGPGSAWLSLTLANCGNAEFSGPLVVGGTEMETLSLAPGEQTDWSGTIAVNLSSFTGCEIDENGCMTDYLPFKIKVGENEYDARITRTLDQKTTGQVKSVNGLQVKNDGSTLKDGSKLRLEKNETALLTGQVISDSSTDDLDIVYQSGNADVAAVLPDGTVIPLANGTTTVSAILKPGATVLAGRDGFEVGNETYLYPSEAVTVKTFTVQVGASGGGGGGNSGSSGKPVETPIDPSVTDPAEPADPAEAHRFSDMSESDWFYKAVTELAAKGIVSGIAAADAEGRPTGVYQFNPDGSITRAEFATLLAKAAGADLSKYSSKVFNDVDVTDWYAAAAAWASEAGVASGTGNGSFSPNANITRQDMAVMVSKYLTNVAKTTLTARAEKLTFTDADQIAEYAKAAVEGMQTAGVISGVPNKDAEGSPTGTYQYRPSANATRAEAAAMVNGLLNELQKHN